MVGKYEALTDRNPRTLEREYRCEACKHVYKTEERVVEGAADAFILTPRSPHPARFDTAILEAHLVLHLKKLLTAEQRHGVAMRTSTLFPRRLPHLARVDPVAGFDAAGDAPVLEAPALRQVVLEAFRDETRRQTNPSVQARFESAMALYWLTQVGVGLPAFAKWLRETYRLRKTVAAGTTPRNETWIRPRRNPVAPSVVVKNRILDDEGQHEGEVPPRNDRAERRRRDHVPFRPERLHGSILAALGADNHGQPITNYELSERLMEWVLWGSDGQPVVRSSQLAASAAGALRRSAPVAYVRWSILGKELRPEEMLDETNSLIASPPVPLLFEPPRAPGLQQPPAGR